MYWPPLFQTTQIPDSVSILKKNPKQVSVCIGPRSCLSFEFSF